MANNSELTLPEIIEDVANRLNDLALQCIEDRRGDDFSFLMGVHAWVKNGKFDRTIFAEIEFALSQPNQTISLLRDFDTARKYALHK